MYNRFLIAWVTILAIGTEAILVSGPPTYIPARIICASVIGGAWAWVVLWIATKKR